MLEKIFPRSAEMQKRADEMPAKLNALWKEHAPMKNKDKIQQIIDQQIEKLRDLSEKAKMPLNPQDINSLTALAKLIDEGDKLERKEKNKADEFSPEELLMIYEHRKNSKK